MTIPVVALTQKVKSKKLYADMLIRLNKKSYCQLGIRPTAFIISGISLYEKGFTTAGSEKMHAYLT